MGSTVDRQGVFLRQDDDPGVVHVGGVCNFEDRRRRQLARIGEVRMQTVIDREDMMLAEIESFDRVTMGRAVDHKLAIFRQRQLVCCVTVSRLIDRY